mgnify:CR=1 FL=1
MHDRVTSKIVEYFWKVAFWKMKIIDNIQQSELFKQSFYDSVFMDYFSPSFQKLILKMKSPSHKLKQEIITTQITNRIVSNYGCNAIDMITCYGTIPIDYAIHQLLQLEHTLNASQQRSQLTTIPELTHYNNTLIFTNLSMHLLEETMQENSLTDATIPMPIMPLIFGHKKQRNTNLNHLNDHLQLFHLIHFLLLYILY